MIRSAVSATLIISVAACEPITNPFVRAIPIDRYPAWSPDGQRIAFEHLQGEGDPEPSGLYVVNADGSGRQLLVEDASGPSWSPDGRHLVYHHFLPDLHIYRLDLETGEEVRLTDGDFFNRFPAWSPDGSRIAFGSEQSTPGFCCLPHLMNPDGSEDRRVRFPGDTLGGGEFPSWSPDGQSLALVFVAVSGQAEVIVVDTAGGEVRSLTRGQSPAWGPTGEWIAYQDPDAGGSPVGSVRLIRPDGTDARTIVSGGHPAWSPEGEWFVLARRGADAASLWVIRKDGTGLRQLTDPGE